MCFMLGSSQARRRYSELICQNRAGTSATAAVAAVAQHMRNDATTTITSSTGLSNDGGGGRASPGEARGARVGGHEPYVRAQISTLCAQEDLTAVAAEGGSAPLPGRGNGCTVRADGFGSRRSGSRTGGDTGALHTGRRAGGGG